MNHGPKTFRFRVISSFFPTIVHSLTAKLSCELATLRFARNKHVKRMSVCQGCLHKLVSNNVRKVINLETCKFAHCFVPIPSTMQLQMWEASKARQSVASSFCTKLWCQTLVKQCAKSAQPRDLKFCTHSFIPTFYTVNSKVRCERSETKRSKLTMCQNMM